MSHVIPGYKSRLSVEMFHFLIFKMTSKANSGVSQATSVLSAFYKFLVIKIAERVQQIAREKCVGCVGDFVLDQLHPCMKLTLIAKVERFLPKAKQEALTRIDNLFELYAKTTWIVDGVAYKEGAEVFIEDLESHHILDRRYVNEDSVFDHPFDTSWLVGEPLQTQIPTTNVVVEPTSVKRPKSRKGKDLRQGSIETY